MTDEERGKTWAKENADTLICFVLEEDQCALIGALLRERDAYKAVVDAARQWKTLWDDGWAPDKGPELDLWKALDALDAKGDI